MNASLHTILIVLLVCYSWRPTVAGNWRKDDWERRLHGEQDSWTHLYVNGASGSDTNPGTLDKPFKTIQHAQAEVQAIKKQHGGHVPSPGIAVNVAAGDYDFTTGPLQLTEADSGEANGLIVYSGSDGTRLLAGKNVPMSIWEKYDITTDLSRDHVDTTSEHRQHLKKDNRHHHFHEHRLIDTEPTANVMKVDLKKLGITNFGDLSSGALGDCTNNKLEAFFNNQPMVLARYPNMDSKGRPQFLNIAKVVNSSSFQFEDKRLASVQDTSTLWVHGYWKFDWADNYVHVLSVDKDSSTIHSDPKTPPLYSYTLHARFYALNSMDFLDSPMEYYVDRAEGMLYFIPPADFDINFAASEPLVVSVGKSIITMNTVSHVVFTGFEMLYSQGIAITGENLNSVYITSCVIANHAAASAHLSGLFNVIHNVTVYGNGCSGLDVGGGDYNSLTRGNNSVDSCRVHNWARWKRTYQPGIGFFGVGNFYSNNMVYDAPHTAMIGACNDCTFVGNTISNVCYEATDTGAFYTGRSWIHRGNVITGNTFMHIRIGESVVLGSKSVQAIYLDDQMSGYIIFNNTFIDCHVGMFVGGGRRNIVYKNHFEKCDSAVHLDARGLSWQKSDCSKGGMFEQQMEAVHYTQPPWSTHYPEMLKIFSEYPCYPAYTSYTENTYCNCSKFADVSSEQAAKWHAYIGNNTQKC